MNDLLSPLAGPSARALGLPLLHTLWQAPLAAAALWFVLRRLSAARAGLRHAAALSDLAAVALAAPVTFGLIRADPAGARPTPPAIAPFPHPASAASTPAATPAAPAPTSASTDSVDPANPATPPRPPPHRPAGALGHPRRVAAGPHRA